MRSILAFTLAASLMTSCASTMTNEADSTKKIPQREIKSLTFINGSPPLPAQQRRNRSLMVDSDLNSKMQIKDGYNTVLSEKTGKITRAQFDDLSKQLNAINYVQLKPGKSDKPMPGSGTETLIISSDLGAHRFINGGSVSFPEPIKKIFEQKDQLLPE